MSPSQGERRGFESHRPLLIFVLERQIIRRHGQIICRSTRLLIFFIRKLFQLIKRTDLATLRNSLFSAQYISQNKYNSSFSIRF